MDNKKWYKKFATIFWWTISALPILIILLIMIGTLLNIKEQNLNVNDITTYINTTIANNTFYTNIKTIISNLSINALTTTFDNLARIIGVNNHEFVGIILGYMLTIAMYHLLYDLLIFFIHLLHSFCDEERWHL